MSVVAAVLSVLGISGIVVAAIAWVARAGITQWLSRDLEAHKANLSNQSEKAIEQLRHELRLAELRQGRLFDRQAEIIAAVFAGLDRTCRALYDFARPVNHPVDGAGTLADVARDEFERFRSYFYEHAIWLDPKTCDQVNGLIDLLIKLYNNLSANLNANGQVADRKWWVSTLQRLDEEVPIARRSLDEQFRTLLGVPIPASTPTRRLGAVDAGDS